jgi:anti-sigma B factor antagonist
MPDRTAEKPFTFEIERNGESAVVKCHGRLVLGCCDDFYPAMKALLPETKDLLIDLADLSYVDSMGLGTLVRVYVSARQSGCRVTLEHLGKQVRNVLSITNLLSVFAHAEDHNITIA